MSSIKPIHNRQTGTPCYLRIERQLPWALNYFTIVGAYTLWRTTFYNFALSDLLISPVEIAYLFTAASIPTLFTFYMGTIVRYITVTSLICSALVLLGSGLIILGNTSKTGEIYAAVILISSGFNWYLPLINTVTINHATFKNVNLNLGRFKSLGPLAAIATTFLVFCLDEAKETNDLLLLTGVVVLFVSGVYRWTNRLAIGTEYKTGVHFNIRLWPIYLLNFLAGSRSALFKAFVITQFVARFDLTTSQLSSILLAGSIAGFFGYRLLGWLSTVYSAKNVLTSLYFLVALLFIGLIYADLTAYISLFLLDSLLFGSAVMTDGHLKRADCERFLVGNLATGTTFFHLAGFMIPLLLAGIWNLWGQAAVLCFGTLIALAGCVTARYLPD